MLLLSLLVPQPWVSSVTWLRHNPWKIVHLLRNEALCFSRWDIITCFRLLRVHYDLHYTCNLWFQTSVKYPNFNKRNQPKLFLCDIRFRFHYSLFNNGIILVMLPSRIIFSIPDPEITVTFDRESAQYKSNSREAMFINVTCSVTAAYGEPKITLLYIGARRRTEVETSYLFSNLTNRNGFFDGIHQERLLLPTTGYIQCRVKDKSGLYRVSEPIVTIMSGKRLYRTEVNASFLCWLML